MEQIKTYIINLPQEHERRKNILAETVKYPCLDVEMVKAIYGKILSDNEKDRLFDKNKFRKYYGRTLLPGEIGCTLSHRNCYKLLLESEYEFALILEDDAYIKDDVFSAFFIKSVMEFMNSSDPVVLLLHADFESIGSNSSFYGKYDLYAVYSALFTTAYLLNKSAARLFLQKEPPYFWVADDWHLFRKWGAHIYSLFPSVVVQQWDKFSTSIQEERTIPGRKRILPHSWIECRLAYEKLVYLFLKKIGVINHLQDR